MVRYILEITFLLSLTFLILSRADSFGTAIRAVGGVYNAAVRTLQGR